MNTTITVFSGNLFAIASQYLGDATQWIRIARLNNLTDPIVDRMTSLSIPPTDPNAGGGIVIQP